MSQPPLEGNRVGAAARTWFLGPPRPHGEQLKNRSVGFLELFYDLVFVVFISRIAATLAGHVSVRTTFDYGVLFCMLWVIWFNGSLYHELHGREDGRARMLMFIQMGMLALLAVYAGHAAGPDGRAFAWILTALLVVQTYQWDTVRRVDRPQHRALAMRYILGSVAAIILSLAAALVDDPDLRMGVWSAMVVVTVAGAATLLLIAPPQATGFSPTGSVVERFGLFVIIVLGEVVVGVVGGLSAAERDGRTIVVGVLALSIGFGFWWTYFDFIGERLPRDTARSLVGWLMGHLPLTLAIAAAGAGMVGLVEHASDARTPTGFAWLLSGSVATMLIACAAITTTLTDRDRIGDVYGPVIPGLLAAALGALVIGWAHPTPWLFALANTVLLAAVWWLGFVRFVARDVPARDEPAAAP